MKKLLLLVLLFSLSLSVPAQFRPLKKRRHIVNKTLKAITAAPDFQSASFSFYAVDINSGEVIAELNPDKVLRPASTLKLLTTATALELLGPDYKFVTTLGYSGAIDTVRHILNGNLIISGGGDPTLGSKYFDATNSKQFLMECVTAAHDSSIDSINGGVIADASFFSRDIVPPARSWKNMSNYYGAGACGLSIYDDYYTVCWKTGNEVGDTAKLLDVTPYIPNLTFDIGVIADSINYDNSYIYGAPYSGFRTIRGQLPVGRSRFCVKGSMPDPPFIAALQIDSAFCANGIGIKNPPTTFRRLGQWGRSPAITILYRNYSPALSQIITKTNVHSINLFAEHLMVHAGIKLGAFPDIQISVDSVIAFWDGKGMDVTGMSLHDGSGLSQYNVISPRQMVFLLSYMKNKSNFFDLFYNSLPIGGLTGTLEGMFKNSIAEGNIRAKSGTIDGVKAYAGYITTKLGREVAFSMMVNNFSCSSREAKAKLEYLMEALAEFDK